MTQTTIYELTERERLRCKAAEWIEANPKAFAIFERLALQMAERNRCFGMGQLTEVVRWEVATTWGKDAAGFKINNNFRAYVGRELVSRHPHLAAFIEFRRCRDEREGEPEFQVTEKRAA